MAKRSKALDMKRDCRLDFGAIVMFEETTGQSLFSAIGMGDITQDDVEKAEAGGSQIFDMKKLKFGMAATIIWCGLARKHPELTRIKVIDLLSEMGSPMEAMMLAITKLGEAISDGTITPEQTEDSSTSSEGEASPQLDD